MKYIFLGLCIICYQSLFAQTFEVDTILKSGTKDTRINFVILSDGYQTSELAQFKMDATNFTTALFNETPYKEYRDYFNVYAINVPSKESGASHPGTAGDVSEPAHPVLVVDNYFGSAFDAFGIHRLLVPNNTTALYTVLANNFPTYNQAIVLVNSPYYGGSGGKFATASLHSDSKEICIHELGHSFVGLIDEYYAGDGYSREGINMTRDTDSTTVKWANWHGKNGIGIYQHCCGGNSAQWYRPHQQCKMRVLNQPFCSVCIEGTIEKIHDLTSPIVAYNPQNTSTISLSEPTIFSQVLIKPSPNTLKSEWLLNGKHVGNNVDTVIIIKADLKAGMNQLIVVISDTSSLLKINGHESIHVESISWNIDKSTLQIEEANLFSVDIKLYPNPTSYVLTIEMTTPNNDVYDIEIKDLSGKRIKSVNGLNAQHAAEIDLNQFTSGTYIFCIKFKNGTVVTKNVFKY